MANSYAASKQALSKKLQELKKSKEGGQLTGQQYAEQRDKAMADFIE